MAAKLIHGYEVVIGFETHTQLTTSSKIFSRASTAFGAEPNTQACAVDLALPGTLPVMNKAALDAIIKAGLLLGCEIAPRAVLMTQAVGFIDAIRVASSKFLVSLLAGQCSERISASAISRSRCSASASPARRP